MNSVKCTKCILFYTLALGVRVSRKLRGLYLLKQKWWEVNFFSVSTGIKESLRKKEKRRRGKVRG